MLQLSMGLGPVSALGRYLSHHLNGGLVFLVSTIEFPSFFKKAIEFPSLVTAIRDRMYVNSSFSPKANEARLVSRLSAWNSMPSVHGEAWEVLDQGRAFEQHPPKEWRSCPRGRVPSPGTRSTPQWNRSLHAPASSFCSCQWRLVRTDGR